MSDAHVLRLKHAFDIYGNLIAEVHKHRIYNAQEFIGTTYCFQKMHGADISVVSFGNNGRLNKLFAARMIKITIVRYQYQVYHHK